MENPNEFQAELAAELTAENQLAPAAEPNMEMMREEDIATLLEAEDNVY